MSYSGRKDVGTCLWDSNELEEVNSIKFLTTMQVLVMFMIYTIMACLAEKRDKSDQTGKRARQFVEEFVYEHFMYFIIALFVHTLVVRSFHMCLLGIYGVILLCKAFFMQKGITKGIQLSFWLELSIVCILTILVVTDDWCRFFLYRAHS